MFLAFKEMKKEKGRFFMIVLITILIAYLVFFLTGLSYGLAKANTTAIDDWNVEGIILAKSANQNIYASGIDESVFKELDLKDSQGLNVASAVVTVADQKEQQDIVLMGFESNNSNLIAPLVEGRQIENDQEIVLSKTFKDLAPVKIGDTLKVNGSGHEFKIVGFSEDARYNTRSVGFVTLPMASPLMLTEDAPSVDKLPVRYAGIVVKDAVTQKELGNKELEYLSMKDFINAIPGYQPQVLTFGLMIVSLIVIASVIIGIFMYILTMQKKSIFAILKVQGISEGYISKAVIYQTLIISLGGLIVGLLLTLLTFVLLPVVVPVKTSWLFNGVISLSFIVCALLGSVFSARSVLKIDPLDAL